MENYTGVPKSDPLDSGLKDLEVKIPAPFTNMIFCRNLQFFSSQILTSITHTDMDFSLVKTLSLFAASFNSILELALQYSNEIAVKTLAISAHAW